jgi:deoxyribose-phosphate aldolase
MELGKKGNITDQVMKDKANSEKAKIQELSIYDQALAKYNTDIKDEDIKAAVEDIIANKVAENDTVEVKKFLFGSVELTSLNTADTEEKILAMVEKVNSFAHDYTDMPHVATVVTYPSFTKLVRNTLEVDGVNIANVSGCFPSSQARMEVKVAETALAIQDGADEIDIVMPVGKFLSEDYEGVAEDIMELKSTCGEEIPMKVILETGDLLNCSNIKKASILSMYAGADYIKTSTGKEKISATPEAVYVMCTAIKEYFEETGNKIGLKPAGGLNTVQDALIYYTIVKEVLGKEWLTNKMFRLGTSRLANLLLSAVQGKEVKYF